jgi:hypothetical protein
LQAFFKAGAHPVGLLKRLNVFGRLREGSLSNSFGKRRVKASSRLEKRNALFSRLSARERNE